MKFRDREWSEAPCPGFPPQPLSQQQEAPSFRNIFWHIRNNPSTPVPFFFISCSISFYSIFLGNGGLLQMDVPLVVLASFVLWASSISFFSHLVTINNNSLFARERHNQVWFHQYLCLNHQNLKGSRSIIFLHVFWEQVGWWGRCNPFVLEQLWFKCVQSSVSIHLEFS